MGGPTIYLNPKELDIFPTSAGGVLSPAGDAFAETNRHKWNSPYVELKGIPYCIDIRQLVGTSN